MSARAEHPLDTVVRERDAAERALRSLARFMEKHAGHYEPKRHEIIYLESEAIACSCTYPMAQWRLPAAYRRGKR